MSACFWMLNARSFVVRTAWPGPHGIEGQTGPYGHPDELSFQADCEEYFWKEEWHLSEKTQQVQSQLELNRLAKAPLCLWDYTRQALQRRYWPAKYRNRQEEQSGVRTKEGAPALSPQSSHASDRGRDVRTDLCSSRYGLHLGSKTARRRGAGLQESVLG